MFCFFLVYNNNLRARSRLLSDVIVFVDSTRDDREKVKKNTFVQMYANNDGKDAIKN